MCKCVEVPTGNTYTEQGLVEVSTCAYVTYIQQLLVEVSMRVYVMYIRQVLVEVSKCVM